MAGTANEPIGSAVRAHGSGRLAELTARLRTFGRRHRMAITVVGSLATVAVLAVVLAGRRHEFAHALSQANTWILVAAAALQAVALLARSEAWHLTIESAGGTVARRALYRASSMQVLGGVLNAQMGVAARIAALRRSSPEVSPQIPTLIAAELPIMAVEAAWGALASFTLIAPLGLPWWAPLIALAVIGAAGAGLRRLALPKGRELWRGLAIIRTLGHGSRLVAFLMVAVSAQIGRNWILLHAVGVHASVFDATAVLIAVSTLMQLPLGPGAGAAAALLILGSNGVAAAAAAGVLMTVTGLVGGLCFAAWAGADQLWSISRRRRAAKPTDGARSALSAGALGGQDLPRVGHTFELVDPAVLELDARPRDEVADSARHEDLAGPRERADPGGDVHRHSGDVVAADLALPGVQAGPDLDPQPDGRVGGRLCAADPRGPGRRTSRGTRPRWT